MADVAADMRPSARHRVWPLPRGLQNALWAVASCVVALALWSAVVLIVKPPAYILPAPWDVLVRTWTDRGLLFANGGVTMAEILIGLGIGIGVGVPLGIVIVAIPVVERLFYPIVVAFNAIPKVALAPLFVVWFGYGFLPRVLITGSITFFPVLVATISGLVAIDPELLRLASVLRAKRSRVFLRMRLPNALPSIFSGIKVATSLGVIGGIIAEFVASDKVWGYLLVQASGTHDTTIMFSIVIILAIVASVLFYIVGFAERFFVSWHASQRDR